MHPPPPPPPPPAPTASLAANPNVIEQGQSTTLSWRTENATDVSLEGMGSVEANGSHTMTPTDSTTYRLIAKGPGGTQEATARVTVTAAPPPPAAGPSDEELFARNVKDIFFDYGKYKIRPDAASAIAADAAFLTQHPNIRFLIEGHSHERGSTEYNHGLGDQRALAVKRALLAEGISADRMGVVSYGKEKPFCDEETEACAKQNRRAHFVFALDHGTFPVNAIEGESIPTFCATLILSFPKKVVVGQLKTVSINARVVPNCTESQLEEGDKQTEVRQVQIKASKNLKLCLGGSELILEPKCSTQLLSGGPSYWPWYLKGPTEVGEVNLSLTWTLTAVLEGQPTEKTMAHPQGFSVTVEPPPYRAVKAAVAFAEEAILTPDAIRNLISAIAVTMLLPWAKRRWSQWRKKVKARARRTDSRKRNT